MSNAVGDRQSNNDPLLKQPPQKVAYGKWPSGVQRGKRQHNKMHHQPNRPAKIHPAQKRILVHKLQSAARSVVNRRGRKRDEEVQKDAEKIGANSSLFSLRPKQPSSDKKRYVPTQLDTRLQQVQRPGEESAHSDRQ